MSVSSSTDFSARQPEQRLPSDFTALARQIQDAGWMRRRYGYYGLNTVGLKGDDPFPCPLVTTRRVL